MTMMNSTVIAVGIPIRGTLLLLGSVFWPRSLRRHEQIISVSAARDCCEHIIHFAMPGPSSKASGRYPFHVGPQAWFKAFLALQAYP